MAQQPAAQAGIRPPHSTADAWRKGFAIYAGVMMIIAGAFGVIEGIAGIARESFYVVAPHNIYQFNTTGWGWVHLVIGVVLILAGIFVFSGLLWARVIGIIAAAISAISNFMFLPHYPFWSILIIALDVLAIWGLSGYNREAAGRA